VLAEDMEQEPDRDILQRYVSRHRYQCPSHKLAVKNSREKYGHRASKNGIGYGHKLTN